MIFEQNSPQRLLHAKLSNSSDYIIDIDFLQVTSFQNQSDAVVNYWWSIANIQQWLFEVKCISKTQDFFLLCKLGNIQKNQKALEK